MKKLTLKQKLEKSQASGDELAEILNKFLYLKGSRSELKIALENYSKIEGWFPNDFINTRINQKEKRKTK